MSARFWSAPVLWRFGGGRGMDGGRNFSTATPRSRGKAVEDNRSPRRFATAEAAGKSARFWSAATESAQSPLSDGEREIPRSRVDRGFAANGAKAVTSPTPSPQSKTLRDRRGRREIRQVLECGDGVCGVGALGCRKTQPCSQLSECCSPRQSGDFADSVTAVQDASRPPRPLGSPPGLGVRQSSGVLTARA